MNLPAHLQQYRAPDIASSLSQTLGTAMPPSVSIGGGRFTLVDAAGNEQPVPTFDPQIGVYLDACIVDVNANLSRIYYAGAYDNQALGTRPDCFSDNGTAPSIHAGNPQAPSCTVDPDAQHFMPDPTGAKGARGCFWAMWGSRINPNGKGVPACSQKQKVALLIPGMPTLFLLAVPPNSHSYLREYVEKCKGSGVNIADVVTRIYFVPGVQGTLAFSGVTYIDEPTAKLRQAAYDEKKTDALIGRTDVPRQAVVAPAQQGQIAAPQNPNMGVAPGQPGGQPQSFAQPQVQQPGPFAPQATQPLGVQGGTPANGTLLPSSTGQNAPTSASPSEPTRRRRRTSAEVQAANGAAAGQPTPQAAQTGPQAPFPHAEQTAAQAGPAANFGIGQGQPAAANPELAGMLDNFFAEK